MSNCKARQYSDQMLCQCGLAWDTNDPEPPECPAYGVRDVRDSAPPVPDVQPAREAFRRMREALDLD